MRCAIAKCPDMQDAWTVFLNCVLLFVALFYVFPLKFLTLAVVGRRTMGSAAVPDIDYLAGPMVMTLYSTGVLVIFGTFVLLHIHAWRLREDHPVSPLTSTTVLNRLVRKGFLSRARVSGRLHFSARLDESDFVSQASRRAVEGILSLGAEAVTESIVDVLAERDPEQLAELARLIRRKLREQEG